MSHFPSLHFTNKENRNNKMEGIHRHSIQAMDTRPSHIKLHCFNPRLSEFFHYRNSAVWISHSSTRSATFQTLKPPRNHTVQYIVFVFPGRNPDGYTEPVRVRDKNGSAFGANPPPPQTGSRTRCTAVLVSYSYSSCTNT